MQEGGLDPQGGSRKLEYLMAQSEMFAHFLGAQVRPSSLLGLGFRRGGNLSQGSTGSHFQYVQAQDVNAFVDEHQKP